MSVANYAFELGEAGKVGTEITLRSLLADRERHQYSAQGLIGREIEEEEGTQVQVEPGQRGHAGLRSSHRLGLTVTSQARIRTRLAKGAGSHRHDARAAYLGSGWSILSCAVAVASSGTRHSSGRASTLAHTGARAAGNAITTTI